MGAIGAGIAAFMIPMVAADWIASFGTGENLKLLLTNIGGAIGGFIGGIGAGVAGAMKDVDGAKLKELGEGIEGVGKGMIAAAAGMTVGLIGGLMSGIGSFFGVESPIDKIIAISKDTSIDAARLKELGEGIGPLGAGLAGFAGLDFGGGVWDKLTGGTLESDEHENIKRIRRTIKEIELPNFGSPDS